MGANISSFVLQARLDANSVERPVPQLTSSEDVLVKLICTGISDSGVEYYESAGIVAQLGSNVTTFRESCRVFVSFTIGKAGQAHCNPLIALLGWFPFCPSLGYSPQP